jgi:hypothetical protein
MPKFKVTFSVEFETTIECERENLSDAIADIIIPEDNNVKYVSDTFDPTFVIEETGQVVPVEDI